MAAKSDSPCPQREGFFRRECRRHYLSEHERLLADAIGEASLGLGLDAVLIPKLDVLSELTGVPKPHVSKTIAALQDMRVIRVDRFRGLPRYAPNLDTDKWKVKARIARATVLRARELLLEVNELVASPKPLVQPVTDSVTVTDFVTMELPEPEKIDPENL